MSQFRIVDLFCGIGGFYQGLKNVYEDVEVVLANDIDPDACAIYEENYGIIPERTDIREIPANNIPDHDILCAGLPCQPFSISGKRDGKHPDTDLWQYVFRIAKVKMPKLVLIENVPLFLKSKAFETLSTRMTALGYYGWYQIDNAKDRGVPQSRERVMMSFTLEGWVPESLGKYPFSPKVRKPVCLMDILSDTITRKKCFKISDNLFINSDKIVIEKEIDWNVKTYKLERVGKIGKGSQGQRIYSPMGLACTQQALGGGQGAKTGLYLMKDGRVRKLSVNEQKRVMGFSSRFKMDCEVPDETCRRLLGNAVVPNMVSDFARTVIPL
jgi:DNA (cytosine-5)-methyltransferase 1